MPTSATFAAMLEEYLPAALLREMLSRPSFVDFLPREDNWAGGHFTVPVIIGGAWTPPDAAPPLPHFDLDLVKVKLFEDALEQTLQEFQG